MSVDLRVYVGGDVAVPDVFGLWQAAPGAEPGAVWEVDVRDGDEREASLAEAAARVALARRATTAANGRLQRFVQQGAGQVVSFEAARALPDAERRLASALALQSQAYFLGELRRDLEQAAEQAGAFARQVQGLVGRPVVVRSRDRGRALGVTGVSWTGDANTAWAAGLAQADGALHSKAVRLALETFRGWLRIALLTAAGAAKLVALLPAGPGALAALPAMWRFVTDILEEYRRLRAP